MTRYACLLGCFMMWSLVARADQPMRLVGYLPDYRAATFNSTAAQPLTDIVIFSAQPTAEGGLDMARLKPTPWDKLRAHRKQHGTRLILCVGGWERSTHFGTVATTEAKRTAFVKAALALCQEQSLDGLDLDWEHPNNEAEQQGYARLLKDLHTAFAPKKLTLSVTMAAWQQLPKEAFASVDTVNLMAYDHDGQHATFENAQRDIKRMLDAGAPANKLVLGVPFYGRHVSKRNQTLTYREIVAQHRPKPDVDDIDGLYFNGPTTIRRKAELARDQKLAGLMVWEIGQDADGDQSLLRVLHATIRKK